MARDGTCVEAFFRIFGFFCFESYEKKKNGAASKSVLIFKLSSPNSPEVTDSFDYNDNFYYDIVIVGV